MIYNKSTTIIFDEMSNNNKNEHARYMWQESVTRMREGGA